MAWPGRPESTAARVACDPVSTSSVSPNRRSISAISRALEGRPRWQASPVRAAVRARQEDQAAEAIAGGVAILAAGAAWPLAREVNHVLNPDRLLCGIAVWQRLSVRALFLPRGTRG